MSLVDAYKKALACDPTSAFGGIVALNRALDADAAKAITEIFTEVIIAPDASEEAIKIVAAKKNLRLLLAGGLPDPRSVGLTVKSVAGGLLVQSRDNAVVDEMQLKVVTKRAPSEAELADLRFAFRVAKHVKSNTIVYAKDRATVGIGAGQMSRVDAARIAALKAQDAARELKLADAADQGLGGRLRCLLPVPRRATGGDRGRRHRGDPARRLGQRRQGDRRRRRAQCGDGVHRCAAFQALRSRFHPPLEGEGRQARSEATCEPGWGDSGRKIHPTPPLAFARVDPPPPGEGDKVTPAPDPPAGSPPPTASTASAPSRRFRGWPRGCARLPSAAA